MHNNRSDVYRTARPTIGGWSHWNTFFILYGYGIMHCGLILDLNVSIYIFTLSYFCVRFYYLNKYTFACMLFI